MEYHSELSCAIETKEKNNLAHGGFLNGQLVLRKKTIRKTKQKEQHCWATDRIQNNFIDA